MYIDGDLFSGSLLIRTTHTCTDGGLFSGNRGRVRLIRQSLDGLAQELIDNSFSAAQGRL
jgi:hypothetical protein